jgi:hypothetical protein
MVIKSIRFTIIFLLTFCCLSCDSGTSFEYKVTGTVPTAQISYYSEHGWITNPTVVSLPHIITFHSKQNKQLYITAKNLSESGEITVEIYVDGVLVNKDTSTEPYGTVNASYNH